MILDPIIKTYYTRYYAKCSTRNRVYNPLRYYYHPGGRQNSTMTTFPPQLLPLHPPPANILTPRYTHFLPGIDQTLV